MLALRARGVASATPPSLDALEERHVPQGPVRVAVNGVHHELEVEPRLLLVHLLRDELGLTGTHVGCDTSNCGACTVHLDGQAVKCCTRPRRPGRRRRGHDDRGARHDGRRCTRCRRRSGSNHGLQCGYCTPGMIMAARRPAAAQPGPDRGGGPPRRSRATSAAAPATTTSSRRCSTPRSTGATAARATGAAAEARAAPSRQGAGA